MNRELLAALLVVTGMLVFMTVVIALAATVAYKVMRWADARDKSEADRAAAAAIAAYDR